MLVMLQFCDQLVVESMVLLIQFVGALEDDHHQAVAVGFLEYFSDVYECFCRRGVQWDQGALVRFGHRLELRDDHIDHDHQRDPPEQDQQRKLTDRPGEECPLRLFGADGAGHAESTWHHTPACSPVAVCSDRTWPSTVIRQPTLPPATCAGISAVAVVNTVVSVCVHGNAVRSTSIGLELTSQ